MLLIDSLIKNKYLISILLNFEKENLPVRPKGGQFGDHLCSFAGFIFIETWVWGVLAMAEVGSEPVPGIVAVAARWTSIAMGLVGVLIGVLVILVGVLLLSTVLRARRHAVASLMRSLIVVVFVWCHQVAPFVGCRVVSCVVALSHSLALVITRMYRGHW